MFETSKVAGVENLVLVDYHSTQELDRVSG